MAVDVAMEKQGGLVEVTLTGPVGADEFLADFQHMLELPDFRPGMKILVNMLEHVHQVTGEDMKRIATVFVQNGEALRGAEVAVVVCRPVSYGMMRMLQIFIEGAPFRLSVFYDLEEAKEWLGVA